jgi:hypothetical protein
MTLETWLETARANLAPRARELVREQITEHFQNASHRYQVEGKGEVEARELAIKDLGDAKAAARGFEKAYLTQEELESFVNLKKDAAKFNNLIIALSMLPTAVLALNHFMNKGLWLTSFSPISFYFACIFSFRGTIRFLIARIASLRSFLKWEFLIDFMIFGFSLFWVTAYSKSINFSDFGAALGFLGILGILIFIPIDKYKYFVKWRKLTSL